MYQLDVTYPEGSRVYGWEPEGWEPHFSVSYDDDGFRWPRNNRMLSLSGAQRRKRLFESYGATVVIRRSRAVEWDG